MSIFKAMKAKKKRAVDPNAPPRPNLMTHQVKLRDQDNSIVALNAEINRLRERVDSLQNKLNNQTNYLQAIHNQINRNK
jgi:polyhydroxyalkanoate synthesis regulator phasin